MNDLEYQKKLLKTKITSHRAILGLEIRAARASLDPLGIALSLIGFDQRKVSEPGPVLRAAAATLGKYVNPAAGVDAQTSRDTLFVTRPVYARVGGILRQLELRVLKVRNPLAERFSFAHVLYSTVQSSIPAQAATAPAATVSRSRGNSA